METQSLPSLLPSQTINFSVPNPSQTANLSLPLFQGAGFRSDFSTWSLLENGGFMQFNLNLSAPCRVAWGMSVCAALVNGVSNNPVSITVNGFPFITGYSDHNANFHPVQWVIPPSLLKAGNNNITVTLDSSASSQLFIQSVTVSETAITRNNAWNNGGTFSNTDLLWYAKGVGAMMSRALSDPTSWWFFAAIHGQYIVDNDGSGPPPTDYPNWGKIPPVPAVPTTPLPGASVMEQYWDQCQHAGWYFAPWHRGYLYALENILSILIQQMGGPSTWGLPYWNYLDSDTTELTMPPAFSATKLPDGSANPLYVTARYGISGTGSIVIAAPPVNQQCQNNTAYTNQYGGGVTGFVHFGSSAGNLERNPHNLVHTQIGGNSRSTPYYGLMSDPGLAGIDPIFYMHHSNIDRLWAAWNNAGNQNPTNNSDWMNGPSASAGRQFYMPNPDGSAWLYYPSMVNTISQLNYSYQDLTVPQQPAAMTKRLLTLTKSVTENIVPMANNDTPELFGASSGKIILGNSGAEAKVKLDPPAEKSLRKSLNEASRSNLPDDVFLLLEGIKGVSDSNMYSVSVNNIYAGHFSLFGIRKATMKDGHHAGAGLTVNLNISALVDQLHLNENLTSSLDVEITPDGIVAEQAEPITIDRIAVYRLPNE